MKENLLVDLALALASRRLCSPIHITHVFWVLRVFSLYNEESNSLWRWLTKEEWEVRVYALWSCSHHWLISCFFSFLPGLKSSSLIFAYKTLVFHLWDSPSFVLCDFKLTKHLYFACNGLCILCWFTHATFQFCSWLPQFDTDFKIASGRPRGTFIHRQHWTPLRRPKLSLLSVRHTYCLGWRDVFSESSAFSSPNSPPPPWYPSSLARLIVLNAVVNGLFLNGSLGKSGLD